MAKEYFTMDEVNELIPQLQYHFQNLLFHKKEMAHSSMKLRKLGATPQLIGRVPNQARPEIHALQSEMRRHYRDFKQHIFSIENLGGEIKDLELGRVDFPGVQDGEDVTWTWQLGVTDSALILKPDEKKEKTVSIGLENLPSATV